MRQCLGVCALAQAAAATSAEFRLPSHLSRLRRFAQPVVIPAIGPIVIPAKRSASRERKKMSAAIYYGPG
jgi:hypothetical protein